MKWVVTGLDGSGKDTQIQQIIDFGAKKNKKIISYSIWDSLEMFSDFPELNIKQILDVFLTKMVPGARTLFLQSVLLQAERQVNFADCDLAIFNAGIPKYAASEQVLGSPLSLWLAIETHFKYCEKIIYLKCSKETLIKRKETLSTYESQFWDKLDAYRDNLEKYLGTLENVITVDADREPNIVFEQIRVKTQIFANEK